MVRRLFLFILLAILGAPLAATPVAAQFGTIFGDPPPRPPAGVPQRQPPQFEPQPPRGSPPPQGAPAAPQTSQGGIQSQPLAPPPGTAPAPAQPPAAAAPPGQRQPTRGAQPQQQQPQQAPPANTAGEPTDEFIAEPPANKVPNPSGVFAGLDKITGRITSFDAAIGETVQFGALQVTPRACYTRPPTETPHTDAFIEVDEVTLQGEIRRIYTGWMFAASPGLHAIEHPIYDIWLTDCKGGAVAEPPAPEAAPAPARQPSRNQPPPSQRRNVTPR